VRNVNKKALLAPLGVHLVVGSIDDIELLSTLVQASDVVFNFAVPFGGGDAAIQAMVDSLETRARTGHTKPVLLQTSGSGSVLYGENGESGTDIWRVSDFADSQLTITGLGSLAMGSPPRLSVLSYWGQDVSLLSLSTWNATHRFSIAADRGIISAYIIMSPTVYGPGTGLGNSKCMFEWCFQADKFRAFSPTPGLHQIRQARWASGLHRQRPECLGKRELFRLM
jgi:nucleoside-diphosphate-sugar epimerase